VFVVVLPFLIICCASLIRFIFPEGRANLKTPFPWQRKQSAQRKRLV